MKLQLQYTPALSVMWVVERNHIFLINSEQKTSLKLVGEEAALWDLIVRGREGGVVKILAAIGRRSMEETLNKMTLLCERWHKDGWLERN